MSRVAVKRVGIDSVLQFTHLSKNRVHWPIMRYEKLNKKKFIYLDFCKEIMNII